MAILAPWAIEYQKTSTITLLMPTLKTSTILGFFYPMNALLPTDPERMAATHKFGSTISQRFRSAKMTRVRSVSCERDANFGSSVSVSGLPSSIHATQTQHHCDTSFVLLPQSDGSIHVVHSMTNNCMTNNTIVFCHTM